MIHQIAELFVVHLAVVAELLVSRGDLLLAQALAALAELLHGDKAILVPVHGLESLLVDRFQAAKLRKSQITVHIPVPLDEHRFHVRPTL